MSDEAAGASRQMARSIAIWLAIVCAPLGAGATYLVLINSIPDFRLLWTGPIIHMIGLLLVKIASSSSSWPSKAAFWLNLTLLLLQGVAFFALLYLLVSGLPRG